MLKCGNLGEEYIGIPLEFANSFKVWNYFGIKEIFNLCITKRYGFLLLKKSYLTVI